MDERLYKLTIQLNKTYEWANRRASFRSAVAQAVLLNVTLPVIEDVTNYIVPSGPELAGLVEEVLKKNIKATKKSAAKSARASIRSAVDTVRVTVDLFQLEAGGLYF